MKEVAPWCQTKWITLSSGLFLFSSGYAFNHSLYVDSIFLATTSIISANYWRKATYSWRRTLDLYVAKTMMTLYLYKGITYRQYNNNPIIITGYSGLFGLGYMYYLSNKKYSEYDPLWYRYHVGFHILLTIEQFIVLNSILAYMRNKKMYII